MFIVMSLTMDTDLKTKPDREGTRRLWLPYFDDFYDLKNRPHHIHLVSCTQTGAMEETHSVEGGTPAKQAYSEVREHTSTEW